TRSDPAGGDRRRSSPSAARGADRDRLSGAHPAGRRGSGRAVGARGRAGVAARPGRRGAHPGQGRRPPAVAAGGYRAAAGGGGRGLSLVLLAFEFQRRQAVGPHPTGVTMPVIKVSDIAWGRLRSPDLDMQEEFLTRFGLVRTERTATALYMRGTDPLHHIHVTEKGDPKFVGFAYYAASEDDLARLAKAPGASGIGTIDAPGGGTRVRSPETTGDQIGAATGEAAVP